MRLRRNLQRLFYIAVSSEAFEVYFTFIFHLRFCTFQENMTLEIKYRYIFSAGTSYLLKLAYMYSQSDSARQICSESVIQACFNMRIFRLENLYSILAVLPHNPSKPHSNQFLGRLGTFNHILPYLFWAWDNVLSICLYVLPFSTDNFSIVPSRMSSTRKVFQQNHCS